MNWNGLGDQHYHLIPRIKEIFDPIDNIKVTAKNSKTRKIITEHGNTFQLIKLTSIAQYVRSVSSYYKDGGIFSWEGWLYDNDIDYENRAELKMRFLK